MATITLNWNNPSSSAGGTPQGYYIYRADGDINPAVSNGALTNMTKLSGSTAHTSAGTANSATDTTAVSGNDYTYCVVAYNEAGEGITSDILHDTVTA